MQDTTRTVLIHVAATAALVLEWYRGAPILSILIVAAVFFPLANYLMYRKRLSIKPFKRG